MKRIFSIFFIFLCVASEVAGGNAFLCDEESIRLEERAGEVGFEENLVPLPKVKNSVRREPTSRRPLISISYSSVARIAETECEKVKIQYQLHDRTQQSVPVYLVKRVFLI